jgi:hypothetical protein
MKLLTRLGIFTLAFALPFSAGAAVKKEGNWPVTEKKVDLTFDGAANEGLKKLAKEAGWSLVVANGVDADRDSAGVHVDVKGQPADAVLEALFVGHDVVAHRNGSLITIRPAWTSSEKAVPVPPPVVPPAPVAPPPPAAAPEPPPPPPVPPPVPSVRGEDRSVVGGSATIKKGEIVHTVTLAGGTLKVEGTVTGDLVIAGGAAKVLPGAHVVGNATVFGGGLKIEDGGRIDGDIAVMGGSVKRGKGAIVGGRVVDNAHHADDDDDDDDDDSDKHDHARRDPAPPAEHHSRVKTAVEDFGRAMTKMSLLFVLGCVLLALLGPRMERVRVDIASRPMRAFALGLVSTLVGSIGGAILLGVLCITILGIPVAIALALFAVVAVYGGIAATLTTFGAAVLGHRTQNPYVHLLVGCGAFLVLSSIPYLGGLVTFALTMISIGALVATRVGGLLDRFARKQTNLM